jgi:hypothetical protein
MKETTWRRGWRDAADFRHSHVFFWGVEVVGAAVTAFTAGYYLVPEDPSRFEATAYPAIGFVPGMMLSYLFILIVTCTIAPLRQRNEARARVAELEEQLSHDAEGVEISSSYPVPHKETGVAPYGDYILVPDLNIINRLDRTLDADLRLEITPKGEPTVNQVAESAEIINAPASLKGHPAKRQLIDPVRIASQSREVGFAAFNVDGILQPENIDEYWTGVERLNLVLYDAVHKLQIAEYEVWPSFWLEMSAKIAQAHDDEPETN